MSSLKNRIILSVIIGIWAGIKLNSNNSYEESEQIGKILEYMNFMTLNNDIRCIKLNDIPTKYPYNYIVKHNLPSTLSESGRIVGIKYIGSRPNEIPCIVDRYRSINNEIYHKSFECKRLMDILNKSVLK